MTEKKDFKKISISLFSRFSYQIIYLVTIFFLTPFMIHKLGDYYYGLWVMITILVNYMGYTELGITSAIQRNLAVAIGDKDNKAFNSIFNTGLFLNTIICLLIIALSFLACYILQIIKINDYQLISTLVIIMGISLATTFPFKTFYCILTSNIRFDLISISMLVQLLLSSALIIILLNQGSGLVALAISTFIATFFANCFYVFWAKKQASHLILSFSYVQKTTIKSLLGFSLKTFFIQLSDILRLRMDEVVTGAFLSVSLVTTYSIANKLIGAANSFAMMFMGVINPYISKQEHIQTTEQKQSTFFLTSKVMIAMISLVFYGFVFLGKPFIQIWVGISYIKAYYVLIILGGFYLVALSQSMGLQYMLASNKHELFGYVNFIEGVLNLFFSLFYVLIMKLGLIGVALGTLTPALLTKLILQPYFTCKVTQIKLSTYYTFFAKNFLLGLILYSIAGYLTSTVNIDSYLKIFLFVCVFLFFSLIHFVSMLKQEEIKLFIDLVHARYNIPWLKTFYKDRE